jgi:hypothetical protein
MALNHLVISSSLDIGADDDRSNEPTAILDPAASPAFPFLLARGEDHFQASVDLQVSGPALYHRASQQEGRSAAQEPCNRVVNMPSFMKP